MFAPCSVPLKETAETFKFTSPVALTEPKLMLAPGMFTATEGAVALMRTAAFVRTTAPGPIVNGVPLVKETDVAAETLADGIDGKLIDTDPDALETFNAFPTQRSSHLETSD